MHSSKILLAAGVALGSLMAGTASADLNFSWDGFVRSETAFRTSDAEDMFNQRDSGFVTGQKVGGVTETLGSGATLKTYSTIRAGVPAHNYINMQIFRAELESKLQITDEFLFQAKLRGIFDPGMYDNYAPGQVRSSLNSPLNVIVNSNDFGAKCNATANCGTSVMPNGKSFILGYDPKGLSTNRFNPSNLYGRPNFFKYGPDRAAGMFDAQPFEFAGTNYMIDFPALFLEFNHGPLDVRLGMQQIAWGQALFFRILDVPDGLDLRRHSALDLGAEEFSDKRVPAPALRVSWQINDYLTADAYVQKFQPTVFGNPNTPYNLIAQWATIHDNYESYNNRVDYGIRLKGTIPTGVGDVTWQAIAVHEYNPTGVFRLEASGVHRAVNPGFANCNNNGALGVGAAYCDIAGAAFASDPSGYVDSTEYFRIAGAARSNTPTAIDQFVNTFPEAASLGAWAIDKDTVGSVYGTGDVCSLIEDPTNKNRDLTGALGHPGSLDAFKCSQVELNSFGSAFSGAGFHGGVADGGLRPFLRRDYEQEDIFGGGLGYVIDSTPGSFLDQLIINIEAQDSPNRQFTSPDASYKHDVWKNEWTTALVMEKYQRFVAAFPATYFVFQWEHKTHSDLFGRYDGADWGGQMGADLTHDAHGLAGGEDYYVFAFQQPFPNLIWRFDFSMLYDKRGGLLIQPAVRWKPSGNWTVNLFYNFLDGQIHTPNENIVSTLKNAGGNELTLRVGYEF